MPGSDRENPRYGSARAIYLTVNGIDYGWRVHGTPGTGGQSANGHPRVVSA
ncbi:hypothetical protein [Falsirhodobacter sp. alg1]|uniref:hypothetical protein n=1 Tax=Falsirhodobacter sp. alg1 TaxID=1472418 RepID=UPI001EDC1529|nr:hypothetical protein [Falsirhodobacter sp. alg1]